METTAPRTIYQHYEVQRRPDGSLHELGRGAMGITYKAFDTNLHVPVALKVITGVLLPDARARTRFLREARAAAQLRHSNVATVYHLGQEADFCFYTMEFVEGDTLEARVQREGPMDAATALGVCQQAARALQAAHARGLLHRDLKPSNLMLTTEGGETLVKVIDFGLVKSLQQDSADTSSASLSGGLFLGTPLYASPEQCASEDAIDGRADLYSLGATLWFMLTGGPPFKGSVRTVMTQHLTRAPAFETLAGQPPVVIALLRALLAKEAEERPADAADLRARLAEILPALTTSAKTAAPGVPVPMPPRPPSSIFKPDEALRGDPVRPPSAVQETPAPPAEAGSSQTLAAGSFAAPPVPPPERKLSPVRLTARRPRLFGDGGIVSGWLAQRHPLTQLIVRAGTIILILKLVTLPFLNSGHKKQAKKNSSEEFATSIKGEDITDATEKSVARRLEKLKQIPRNDNLPPAARKAVDDAINQLDSPADSPAAPPVVIPLLPPLPPSAGTVERNLETARKNRAAARELKRSALAARHQGGQLSEDEYQDALKELDSEDE